MALRSLSTQTHTYTEGDLHAMALVHYRDYPPYRGKYLSLTLVLCLFVHV